MVRLTKSKKEAKNLKSKRYRVIDPQVAYSSVSSPYISNSISPSEMNWWNLLPLTIYLEFRKLPYFWFLFLICLEMFVKPSEFPLRYYNLISFSILIISSVGQNLIHVCNSFSLGKKFNIRQVQRWKNLAFESVLSKDLRVGDLILVAKGEEIPADILLMDCEGDKKAMFDKSKVIGTKDYVEKYPVDSFKILKELDHNEIFYSLTKIDTINVTAPNPSFKQFKAKIRYKGDPKTYISGLSNFVIGGSIFVSGDWILGLVVYTGMETKFWLNSKSNKKDHMPIMANTLNKIFTINFTVILILVIISVSIASFQDNTMFKIQAQNFLLYYIVLYSNLVSISYFVVLKISRILSAIFMMIKNKHFNINPLSIQEIGRIEYLIVDKEDLIKHRSMKVSIVSFCDITFFRGKVVKKRFSQFDHENLIKPVEINSKIKKQLFCFTGLQNYCAQEENQIKSFEYFCCALFTSQSLMVELQKPTRENEKIIKLCGQVGITFEQKGNEYCQINYYGEVFEFLVLGSYKDTKNSFVIVSNSIQSKASIYLKSDRRLHKKTNENENSYNIFESSDYLTKYKTYFFYKIPINGDNFDQFIYDYKLASNSNIYTSGKLQNLFESQLESYEFLGCISFQYKHHKSIRNTITDLKSSGIKTWMVSGNHGRNAILAGYSSKILSKNTKVKYLVGATDLQSSIESMKRILYDEKKVDDKLNRVDSGKSTGIIKDNQNIFTPAASSDDIFSIIKQSSPKSMRSIQNIRRNKTLQSLILRSRAKIALNLSSENKSLSSNFSLVVDQEFFQYALSSEVSRKVFCALLLLSESICFYGFSPDQKRSLILLLRKNFAHKPCTIAVGDVMCDSGMLEEADVSVLIEKGRENNPYFNPSIIIPKFSNLKNLILIDGHFSYVRLSKILHYSLFKETMVCTLILLEQINSDWSGSLVLMSDQFIIFELFVSLFPILIIGIFEKDCSDKDCKEKKEIYKIGFLDQMMCIKRLVFYSVFGSFQGIIIYLICTFSFKSVINAQGFTENSEIRSNLIFTILSLSLLVKTLMTTRHFYLPTIVSPLLTLALIFIIIFNFSEESGVEGIRDFTSNQRVFWVIGFTVPLFVTYEYFVFNVLLKKFFRYTIKSRSEQYSNKLDSLYKESDNWKTADQAEDIEIQKKTLNFTSQFKEKKYQDQITQELKLIIKVVILLVSVTIILYLILIYSSVIAYVSYPEYVSITVGLSLFFLLCTFSMQIPLSKLFFLFNIFLIINLIIYVSIENNFAVSYYPSLQVIFCLCIIFEWKYTVFQIILSFSAEIYTIVFQGYIKNDENLLSSTLTCFVLVSGLSILCLILSYNIENHKREEFLHIQSAEDHFNKSSQILSYLLPDFVKKRVNDGIRYIAEEQGIVSVIFCDICDFDKIIENYEDKEIISLLDDFFSRIDSICGIIGVTKIETVGKTYLACAGFKDYDSDLKSDINEISHAKRALEFAFEVLNECSKTYTCDGNTLQMKIGIHSGPVVAGVVGYHKPQFSLVGDTVNTASRMATTLTHGNQIQISKSTYNMLEDMTGFNFIKNYPEIKGKGKLQTYLVEHFLINRVNTNDFEETNDKSFSSHRNSIHTEKFTRYTNIEKYNSTMFTRSIDTSRTFKERFWQMLCVETDEEKDFQNQFIDKLYISNKQGLIIFILVNFCLILLTSIDFSLNSDSSSYSRLIVFIAQNISGVILLICLKKIYRYKISLYLFFTLYYSGTFSLLIITAITQKSFIEDLLLFYLHFILNNFCTGLQFTRNILLNFLQILTLSLRFSIIPPQIDKVLITFVFICCVLISSYNRDKTIRKDFITKQELSKEHSKIDQLLTQMMPISALRHLQEEVTVIDKLAQVTIMYADIVGFTSWSSTRTANEVINMLSKLFTKFDKLCVKYDAYKVYTIGDCYVAMGYSGNFNRNPAKECEKLLEFAIELTRIIHEVNCSINAELNMRIGLHIGDVIGGITGTNIVRYDIYGKDAMIANKMESNGVPGRVTVSEKTKEMIEETCQNKYCFEFHKEVKAWDETVKIFLLSEKKYLN